jgi:hypothetical protein
MTQPAGDSSAFQPVRARNTLIHTVRTLLKGTGLDIRELASELVISHPGHPEHGRIYITYAHAEVTHRRTTWHYLGYLDGYTSTDPDAEPGIDAPTITAALTGHDTQQSP